MNQHLAVTRPRGGSGLAVLRVLAVPAAHPYPRHILAEPATDDRKAENTPTVRHLPDPRPVGAATPSAWWPPAAIDPHWLTAHCDTFDLLHLHFGVESFSIDHLRDTVAALRRVGRPLVYTVHDLSNPQLNDQTLHNQQLALLTDAATALITLTSGAAAEIEQRFGRGAAVIAHPHVLPFDSAPVGAPFGAPVGAPLCNGAQPSIISAGITGPRIVIGLSLKDFRPNVDAVSTTTALLSAIRQLRARGLTVRAIIDHQTRVRDAGALAEVRRLAASASDSVSVWEHPRLEDAELFAYLNSLDACVLPYRHGTHSGWLELCWDLGVAVVTPRVGYFAQQHPDSGDVAAFDADCAESLAEALATVLGRPDAAAAGSPARAEWQLSRRIIRRREREQIAAEHLAVYRAALLAGAH